MSGELVIKVDGLGKAYTITHGAAGRERYVALRDVLTRAIPGLVTKGSGCAHAGLENGSTEEFWALKDVSFNIRRGDVVGIIGRNGAGKSTLLKVLSRITEPTKGRVEIKGRLASLLEVGTGFHPELTGRENIYLNGAILGMSRAEIRKKFEEIVAFADVERFLDTPVKRYSSGMYVRLAFAVAAHLEPEILVIDEVLAVGDAEFQKKCLGKIQDIAGHGRTVLFVSHNMGAIRALCRSAMLLAAGKLECRGDVSDVLNQYVGSQLRSGTQKFYSDSVKTDQVTNGNARLVSVRLLNSIGKPIDVVHIDEEAIIEIIYFVSDQNLRVAPIVHFGGIDGLPAFASIAPEGCHSNGEGEQRALLFVPSSLLNDITYRVGICIASLNPEVEHCYDLDALRFDVIDSPTAGTRASYRGRIPGLVRPLLKWRRDADD
jgi:lipopolysaccharide transport system ATP-binding protein